MSLIRAWLTGTLAIDLSTVPKAMQPYMATLRHQLTLMAQRFKGRPVETPFWFQKGSWLYIPRAFPLTSEGSWLRPYLKIEDGRSPGRPLPRWTRMHKVSFGTPPWPAGQPGFIQGMVKGSQQTGIGGLATAPTRSGKTLCSIAAAVELGKSTLILVDNVDIARQWRENVLDHVRAGNDQMVACGLIRAKRFESTTPFAVATVQTLARRALTDDVRRSFGTVLIDECQGVTCDQIFGAITRLEPQYIIGLTATPRRRDGLGPAIPWIVGPHIAALHRQISADVMFLRFPYVKHKIQKAVYVNGEPTGETKLGWPRINSFGRLNIVDAARAMFANPEFPTWLAQHIACARADGRRVLVMVQLRENVEALARACRQLGLDPGLYYGSMSRSAGLKAMAKNPCITTVTKSKKGVDFKPAPTMFVLAAPLSDPEQATGRALQPQAAHTPLLVDVVVGEPKLIKQARRRQQFYRSKGYNIRNVAWEEELAA